MTETIEKTSITSYKIGYSYEYARLNGTGYSGGTILQNNQNNTFLGEKNPKWRDQIRKGQNASTPMEGMLTTVSGTDSPAYIKVEYRNQTSSSGKVWQIGTGYPVPAFLSDSSIRSISSSSAYDEAASLFHLKANDAFRILSTGVIAGEMNETVRLIKRRSSTIFDGNNEYLDRISRYIRRTRGRRSQRVADIVRTASDLWLEYSFGWSPLLNDIENGIDYLNDESKTIKKKIRAIYTDEWNDGSPSWVRIGASGARIKYLLHKKKYHSVLLVGSVSLAGTDGLRLKKLGLHPSDWAPTIYELIPYSFLIDYFTNLNGIVAGMSNLAINIDWATQVTKRGQKLKYMNSIAEPYPQAVYPNCDIVTTHFSPQERTYTKVWTERDPNVSVSIPGLAFSLPSSVGQYLNIAALIGASTDVRRAISNL
jgi:hypothetical protein